MSHAKTLRNNKYSHIEVAFDKDGDYVQITGSQPGVLLTFAEASALRDWLISTLDEVRA